MLYLIAVLLGVLLGIAAKGKLSNLLNIKFKKIWIIILAFIIQAGLRVLAIKGFDIGEMSGALIQGTVYSVLLIGFWFNRHYIGMCIMGTGCFLNGLVMTLNGGLMPVSQDALKKAEMTDLLNILQKGMDGKHIISGDNTRLSFLSDVINLPSFLGMGMRIVSIGDLVIAAGIFIFVLSAVKGKKNYTTDNNSGMGGYINA